MQGQAQVFQQSILQGVSKLRAKKITSETIIDWKNVIKIIFMKSCPICKKKKILSGLSILKILIINTQ